MNIIRKVKSLVYCNLFYHEGFKFQQGNLDVFVCENCRKSFDSGFNLLEKDRILGYYLDVTTNMVHNPKKLSKEDFQLIKICYPELEEYAKLWK